MSTATTTSGTRLRSTTRSSSPSRVNRPFALDYTASGPLGVGPRSRRSASAGPDGRRETEWLLAEVDRSSLVRRRRVGRSTVGRARPVFRVALGLGGSPSSGRRRSARAARVPRGSPSSPPGARSRRPRPRRRPSAVLGRAWATMSSSMPAADAVRARPSRQPRIAKAYATPGGRSSRARAGPNVVCKLSGSPTRRPRTLATRGPEPYVDHALDCFGADRILYGSDWPGRHLAAPWSLARDGAGTAGGCAS